MPIPQNRHLFDFKGELHPYLKIINTFLKVSICIL